MANTVETDPRQATQIAGIVVVVAVAINVMFYFLSTAYFADRAKMYGVATEDHIRAVRMSFAAFTGLVALGSIGAAFMPRIVGHGIAAIGAFAAFAGAVGTVKQGVHVVMPATLIGMGVLLAVLIWRSLAGSRAAWSFLIATCAVLASVTLFGSTKIRSSLDINLWNALSLPGLFVVATAALVMIRDQYKEA